MTAHLKTFPKIFRHEFSATFSSAAALRERLSNRESLKTGSIVAAELLGFFTVGEMIGKRKVVGYRGKIEHAGHH